MIFEWILLLHSSFTAQASIGSYCTTQNMSIVVIARVEAAAITRFRPPLAPVP